MVLAAFALLLFVTDDTGNDVAPDGKDTRSEALLADQDTSPEDDLHSSDSPAEPMADARAGFVSRLLRGFKSDDAPRFQQWSTEMVDGDSQLARVLRITACGLTALAVFAVVLLTPASVIGGNYYECGDPLLKFATLAYLFDSATAERLSAAAFCCI